MTGLKREDLVLGIGAHVRGDWQGRAGNVVRLSPNPPSAC